MSVPRDQVVFDPFAPFPALVAVRDAATAGDWPGVATAYASLESWSLRTAAVRCVGQVPGVEYLFSAAAEPEDAVEARTMLACRLIELGWQARTAKPASHVSRRQFAVFRDHLCRAEQLLIDVTARDPANLAAWTLRVTTARGLSLGLSEARRRWGQIARHDPHHLAAQTQLLQQLCPKWRGTLDQLHGFARDCAAAAPPGALNPLLVVEAHLEHWATLGDREGMAYLRSAPVRDSVVQAAAQSVLNPAFRPAYGWVTAHCYFALYHSVVGDPRSAAVHFRALGPYANLEPWELFFGDAEKEFHRHRGAALGKG